MAASDLWRDRFLRDGLSPGAAPRGSATALRQRAFYEFDRLIGADSSSALVVGLSGGPDSGALLALLAQWCQARARSAPHALVVDHGIRRNSASEAVRVVQRWQGFLGSQVAHTRLLGMSGKSQAALRVERYRALAAHARAIGAVHILTGHHGDDQIETLLERLSRGSGFAGLGGLEAKRRLYPELDAAHVLRPLLFATKADLVGFLTDQGQSFEQDPSNAKRSYARARWRASRPSLADYGISEAAILSLSSACRALKHRQQDRNAALLKTFAAWHDDWAICLDCRALEALEPASQQALVAGLTQIVGWRDYPAGLDVPQNGQVLCANRCVIQRQASKLWIARDPRCYGDMAAGPWRISSVQSMKLTKCGGGQQGSGLSAAVPAGPHERGGIQAAGRLAKSAWPEALKALNLPHSVAKLAPLWRNSRGDWQLATKTVLTLAPNFQTVDQSYRLVTSAMQLRFTSNLASGSEARA